MALRLAKANPKYFKLESGDDVKAAMEKIKKLNFQEDRGLINNILGDFTTAWTYSLIPSREVRHRSMAFSLNFFAKAKITFDKIDRSKFPKAINNGDEFNSGAAIYKALDILSTLEEDYKIHPRRERPLTEKDYEARAFLSPYRWNADWTDFYHKIDQLGGMSVIAAGLCSDLLGLMNIRCGDELKALLQTMLIDSRSIYGAGSKDLITLVDLPNYEDVLGHPDYVLPLLAAAKVLLTRYQNPSNMSSNLYDDLFNAFQSAGLRDFIKGSDGPTKAPNASSYAGELVRIDLSYNAAGALYGAFPNRKYDVDQTILHLKRREDKGSFSFPGLGAMIGLYFKDLPGFVAAYNPNEAFYFNMRERN